MIRPIPLTASDRAFLKSATSVHPANHALVLDFRASPDPPFSLQALRRGAESACRAFPAAASRLRNRRGLGPFWDPASGQPFDLVVRTSDRSNDRERILRDFVNTDFPLGGPSPVRQLLCAVGDPSAWTLVTQAHHAVSDLFGILLLVRHQLRVAAGESLDPEPQFEPPVLRRIRRRREDAPDEARSTAIHTFGRPASRSRHWGTIALAGIPRTGLSSTAEGFSWKDVLLAAALEAVAAWNRNHRSPDAEIGLSVHLDVRKSGLEAFGNGTSRILVFRSPVRDGTRRSFRACCRAVHRAASDKHHAGEWAVPPSGIVPSLMFAVGRRLGRWIGRPGPDPGTASFTLVERGAVRERFPGGALGLEVVSPLPPDRPLAFAAVPQGDEILVTVTWDAGQFRRGEAREIVARFRRLIREVTEDRPRGRVRRRARVG